MKKRINLILTIVAVVIVMLNVNLVFDAKTGDLVRGVNLTASVYADESGDSGESGESGSGETEVIKKLKALDCSCSNGSTGKTAKCRTDGSGEVCTATQQGLNGCYSASVFSPGNLLCQGSAMTVSN